MADTEHQLLLRFDVWRGPLRSDWGPRVAHLRRCDLPGARRFVSATVTDGEGRGHRFGPLDDLLLWEAGQGAAPGAAARALARFAPLPGQTVFAVVVGTGPAAGRWDAAGTHNGAPVVVDRVRLVGPRMLTLHSAAPIADTVPSAWSRVAGAVGEAAFRRLRDLTVAVVGLGRTGTLAADLLARHGVRSLVLIDGDVDEEHVRDGALEPAAVGRHKVLNRADGLVARHPDELTVRAVPRGGRTPTGTEALKSADVVVTCVDDDAARLFTAEQASRYGQPHLDIGTGVFRNAADVQRGADVRLCVAGESCLSCLGGVPNDRARAALARPVGLMTVDRPAEWRERRSGSLPALNMTAVGVGVQMVVDLVAGTRTGGGWVRVAWPPGGAPTVTALPGRAPAAVACPVCGAR